MNLLRWKSACALGESNLELYRMIPASLIPKDQLWFWTPEWQKKEREVDEALARGDYKESDPVDAVLGDLKS